MALTAQQITDILTTKVYADTIADLLLRISDAHEIIQTKAINGMALKIPKGQASNKSGTEAIALTDSHKILDTAAAINSIEVYSHLAKKEGIEQTPTNGILNIGPTDTITIPVGYNITEFQIKLGGNPGSASDEGKYIYHDKIFYTENGDEVEGTLKNVYLYYKSNSDTSYHDNKVNGSNLQVSINKPNGNTYSNDDMLKTNIPYRDASSDILLSPTSIVLGKWKGNLIITPTEGYYDDAYTTSIDVNPDMTLDLIINISPNAEDPDTDNISVTPVQIPAGYYPDGIEVTPIIHGNRVDPDYVLNYFNGTVNVVSKRNKLKNFVTGTYDYFDPTATISVKQGSARITKDVDSDGNVSFSINDFVNGWFESDDITLDSLDIPAAEHDVTFESNNKFGTASVIASNNITTITTPFVKDAITAGYSKTETKYYKVKDGDVSLASHFNNKFGGSNPITTGIGTINGNFIKCNKTEGWIDGTPKYYKVSNFARSSNTAKTIGYYTVGTGGWIGPGQYVGDRIVDDETVIPGEEKSYEAGTVLAKDLTILAVSSGEAYYKIKSTDLGLSTTIYNNNTVPGFKVTSLQDGDGNVSDYMTAITIDMTEFLLELQKI